ncbi:putative dihydropteroate synthase [Magnetofaba australis IT-1]|uniref:Dihydropteroate synthase n=1 Tax=Magnetofaba australis IT-1 TaxID=1434232 RepID=A0A1Y2K3M2_9PROT|nr:putative dihydropteroate synthase [Magnetofaba australis IT-1]
MIEHHGASQRHAVGAADSDALRKWAKSLTDTVAAEAIKPLLWALHHHETPLTPISIGAAQWNWRRPYIMGVVNVTPDSFSDGGQWIDPKQAVEHALELADAGADILDIGGESTRPGAQAVSTEEELARVIPVIEALRGRTDLPLSIDTSKALVMARAVHAGASVINDVTALQGDPDAVAEAASNQAPVCIMHMQGSPQDMQDSPRYAHVTAQVYAYLAERIAHLRAHGVDPRRIWVDPGIGFGKTTAHNAQLLRELPVLRGLGCPVLLGLSRKRVVGDLSGVTDANQRDAASHALGALGAIHGAQIIRVHDVFGARQAVGALHNLTVIA